MTICFKTTFAFFANYLHTHEVFYLIRSTWPLKSKHINEVINFFITTSLFIHPNCLTYIEVFFSSFFSLLSHFSASCQMCLLAIFSELLNFQIFSVSIEIGTSFAIRLILSIWITISKRVHNYLQTKHQWFL